MLVNFYDYCKIPFIIILLFFSGLLIFGLCSLVDSIKLLYDSVNK